MLTCYFAIVYGSLAVVIVCGMLGGFSNDE